MKKISSTCVIALFFVPLFLVLLFMLPVKKEVNYIGELKLANIEALASGEESTSLKECYVGRIHYVIAEARIWCGTCHYDYVNVSGDGYCRLDEVDDGKPKWPNWPW